MTTGGAVGLGVMFNCNSKKQSLLPWEWDAYLTARAPSEAD